MFEVGKYYLDGEGYIAEVTSVDCNEEYKGEPQPILATIRRPDGKLFGERSYTEEGYFGVTEDDYEQENLIPLPVTADGKPLPSAPFKVGECYGTSSGEVWEILATNGDGEHLGVPQPIEALRVSKKGVVYPAPLLRGIFTEEGYFGRRIADFPERNLIPVPVAPDKTPVHNECDSPPTEATSEVVEETTSPDGLRLEKAVLYFSQEPNCIDGGNPEEIRVRIEGSTGCDDSAFAVIETDRWAVEIDELPPSIKAVVNRVLGK